MNKIIKLSGCALMLGALASCSTYSDLKNKQPAYTAVSNKAPEQVTQCALLKLMDVSAGSHIVQNGDASTVVVPIGGGSPTKMQMILVAKPNGAGSRVELIHMSAVNSFATEWQSIQPCL